MSQSASPLVLDQRDRGYRYNQDSFLLADFFRPKIPGLVGDFCAGTGVVSVLAGCRMKNEPIIALEINPEMAAMANQNAAGSGLLNYSTIAANIMDAPRLFKGRPFSGILSNPPYFRRGHGRLNPDPIKAMARHEISMDLAGLVDVAAQLLAPGGALTIVMLFDRLAEYRGLLSRAGLNESRFAEVRFRPSSPPSLFLSEAVYGVETEVVIEPVVIVSTSDGLQGDLANEAENQNG